ncbi:hypothetical protein CEXT_570771 [Caerostris extrusa]|uniref:Uncharacterized protein n=1 Tax=Caerostris extrusa TaxID=172846 RepID=A0AAV4XYA0_CAEEX|nr:hypothetical protein CEXT_570771 [Caerostris extrusa]
MSHFTVKITKNFTVHAKTRWSSPINSTTSYVIDSLDKPSHSVATYRIFATSPFRNNPLTPFTNSFSIRNGDRPPKCSAGYAQIRTSVCLKDVPLSRRLKS